MRDEYDFSKATSRANPFAERLKKEGCTVRIKQEDGRVQTRHYPPGTMPSASATIHVYSVGKRWAVRVEGASRASRTLPTEDEALMVARGLARRKKADIFVHAS